MLCELSAWTGGGIYEGKTRAYVWKPGKQRATEDDYVGTCKLVLREDEAYFCDFGVKLEHRRRGYGTRILREVMGIARKLGYKLFTLCVVKTNTPAIAMYEKLGFTYAPPISEVYHKMQISL